MNKKITIVICMVFISIFSFIACEKDDICDPLTSTTPRLVITFKNINNISTTKATVDLSVYGKDTDEPILTNGNQYINDTVARIPLRTQEDISRLRFVMNSKNEQQKKTDTLQFAYSKSDVYISRACGFKTTYNLFGHESERPILLNNQIPTEGNWIKKIEVSQPNVIDENETHIIIYH